jgi:hypothetical protein
MTPPELRDLLADSLLVWEVAGRAALAEDGARVMLADGTALRVRLAAETQRPIRWWLERDGRRRPCTGTLGLLRALRNALGAEEGTPQRLRMAAGDA